MALAPTPARRAGAKSHDAVPALGCRKRFDTRRLLGLTIHTARARVASLGLTIREVEVDGKQLPVEADEIYNRIDVVISDDQISAIHDVGRPHPAI